MSSSAQPQPSNQELGVYECEVTLKFRIIEEKSTMIDRDHLLETLVDAYAYGDDEYLEALKSKITIEEIDEVKASPAMRRQLIRLRNASWLH